jgi:hypothetical protein
MAQLILRLPMMGRSSFFIFRNVECIKVWLDLPIVGSLMIVCRDEFNKQGEKYV